jgi:hypothetical protein
MEKVIKLLGGKKNGTDHTGVFDIPTLLKNLLTALLLFGSLSFTAGQYFGSAKDLPFRVETVERKQDRVEAKLEAILNNQAAAASDIRELRACIMDRGSRAR